VGGEVELVGGGVVAAMVVVTAVDEVVALLGGGSVGGAVADATTAFSPKASATQPTSTTRPRR
jgi:cephalosporin-C deacetylase-like acetyl esterase